ncbi:hypothetical protein KJ966_17145 [bacterium]|nr:hypothetical protein [bacterium]
MGVFLKAFIFILISYLFTVPSITLSRELVGVVPLTNQRSNQANDWIGFYIQARLQAYLAETIEIDFFPLETLRLWQYKSKPSLPVSKNNSILISGSFQQVLQNGVVNIQMQRFIPEKRDQFYKILFSMDDFEIELDKLFAEICLWINPECKPLAGFKYPILQSVRIETIFKYRQFLYIPGAIPEIGTTLQMKELVDENSRAEFIADLAEGMVIVSKNLLLDEQKAFQGEVELLLRSAAMKHPKDCRILALLAEIYYLNRKDSEWVVKTATEALSINPNNSLALLMQVLATDVPDSDIKSLLDKLTEINPWIWVKSDENQEVVQFQNGLFHSELLQLSESVEEQNTPLK